ncbi:MAG: 2-dehydropantoate 2-reductase [Hyphomicrobiaceae bacterium]|nr:2-dehydropantoate 2-reductase [Hyphomicrobiaceae bacterium]
MKVCIFGAGAIGGYLGIMLARGGADVSLVARGAHLEAIRSDGLKLLIDGETLQRQFDASDDPADLGPQDYVIVALKAHQAWESAQSMKPLLGPSTVVVTAQNGVPWWYFYKLGGPHEGKRLKCVDPGDVQWETIGPERVIGSTVYPATEIEEPGVIRHIAGNRFGLGEPSGEMSGRLENLASLFSAGGLDAKVYASIRDDIWIKLWGNLCFNPISVLTHATLDVIATSPGTRLLAREMMREAQTIGEKLNVYFRVDITRRIDGAARVGAHRTSMLQDLRRGRPIELDALLAAVREMGQIVGVKTPYIDAVLALTQQMGEVAGVYPVYPASVDARQASSSMDIMPA